MRTDITTLSLKKGHSHVLQHSLFPPSLTLKDICSDEKHFEQHERSLAQIAHSHTHMCTHTRLFKSQTHAKRGKLECWNRTFCYSKNTFEGTCGWEHTEPFLIFLHIHTQRLVHTDTCDPHGYVAGMWGQTHTPAQTHTQACKLTDKHHEHGWLLRAKWKWVFESSGGLSGCCFSYSGFVA